MDITPTKALTAAAVVTASLTLSSQWDEIYISPNELAESKREHERSIAVLRIQVLEGDMRSNDLRRCEMDAFEQDNKNGAIFSYSACLRDRYQKELLRLKKSAEELTK